MKSKVHAERFGLKFRHIQNILEIVNSISAIEKVWVFGSRALGTYTESSDIDLMIDGEKLSLSELSAVVELFEQSSIPYKVDVIIKKSVTNTKLLEHIEKYGILIKG